MNFDDVSVFDFVGSFDSLPLEPGMSPNLGKLQVFREVLMDGRSRVKNRTSPFQYERSVVTGRGLAGTWAGAWAGLGRDSAGTWTGLGQRC